MDACGVLVLLPALVLWTSLRATAAPAVAGRVASPVADHFLVQPRMGADHAELDRFQSENHCAVVRHFPGLGGLRVLRAPTGHTVADMVRRYQASGLVEYAEPDYRVQLASVLPNDPKFLDGTLWGLNNTGQNGGLANADMDAPEAWHALTSASDVIVAVIDSGIRVTHEDLAGNLWTHPQDGSHGLNAITGTTNIADDNGHGTLVAGILGATGNNGLGVVGVAWQVRIMACKSFNQFGEGTVSDAIACFDYARTNGARIINTSWGLEDFSLALSNAVRQVGEQGIIVVAAAGNRSPPSDNDEYPFYPASLDLDNVVAVAAATRTDDLYVLSRYGAVSVDLAAPGAQIQSTGRASDAAYATDSGTSMAAAYVSGAAALMRSRFAAESHMELIQRLLEATDPLPSLAGKCVTGGRLNLRKALGPWPTLSAHLANSDQLALQVFGEAGKIYVVEATDNTQSWAPILTNQAGANGSFAFTHTIPTNSPARFFRALGAGP